MGRKIIFFDIDGTLVDFGDRSIPASTVMAIAKARAAGHLLYINSGRPYDGIDPRVRAMGFDGYCCGCGVYVQEGDRVLFHQTLDKAVQLDMVALVRKYGLLVMYEGAHQVYFETNRPLDRREAFEKAYYAGMGLATDGDAAAPEASFDKFVVWTDDEAARTAFCAAVTPWFDVILREDSLIELVPHGCSKANAMDRILACHGLDRADCIAIGDSTNDLPMLEAAGTSVAMGNGDPRIFDKVTFVTAPLQEDGIYKAMERLGLF
jgi:Cof subfamily protein (haloacid dehalogenase superfamily)